MATTITAGATNGTSITNNGRGSLIGPSHHVASPSSRLAFHTPVKATNTMIHVAPVTMRQPGVSWPASGPGVARRRRDGGGRGRRRRRHGVEVSTDATVRGRRPARAAPNGRRYPPAA